MYSNHFGLGTENFEFRQSKVNGWIVSEVISLREIIFHLASWDNKVTWQKWLQWSPCAFVCKALKSHLASHKQQFIILFSRYVNVSMCSFFAKVLFQNKAGSVTKKIKNLIDISLLTTFYEVHSNRGLAFYQNAQPNLSKSVLSVTSKKLFKMQGSAGLKTSIFWDYSTSMTLLLQKLFFQNKEGNVTKNGISRHYLFMDNVLCSSLKPWFGILPKSQTLPF